MKAAQVARVTMTTVLYRAAFCALVGVGLCAALFREETTRFEPPVISPEEASHHQIYLLLQVSALEPTRQLAECHHFINLCPRQALFD